MSELITQSKNINEVGLHISLITFFLPEYIINDNDNICIAVITLPEQNKQHFMLQKKDMYSNLTFSLNILKQTRKIIIDFKKQNFLSNEPTFAFAIINQNDFPKSLETFDQFSSNPITTDIKTLNIFASIHQQEKKEENEENDEVIIEKPNDHSYRKVVGNMKVQLAFSEPLIDIEQDIETKDNNKIDFGKMFKTKTFERKQQYGHSNECCTYKSYGDYFLF